MPGIAGFIASPLSARHHASVQSMVEAMTHEPFYSTGSQRLEEAGVEVGWAVHAGSYADCLPVWNESRDIGLFFTGEHFSDRPRLERLRSAGHQFDSENASALVHLYEETGDNFFSELNGLFSGVLVDRRQKKVILFNDRFGLGRVYFHETNNDFAFASEAKALLRVNPALRRLDPQGLAEWLTCGCTLQHRSQYVGVSVLPPGSKWTFQSGRAPRKETYFSPASLDGQPALSTEDYFRQLKETFNRILPRYFSGRQTVGLSITGGLDSRMIVAGIEKPAGEMPCYTFGGMYRDCADVTLGRRIAEMCGQPHTTIRIDERFFPHFTDLARRCVYLTDGNMDVSGSVGLYANRQARDIAPIRMTGNYGSEILRANVAFRAGSSDPSLFTPDFGRHLRAAQETYRAERAGLSSLSFIVSKQAPWHHYSRLAEEQSQLVIRAPYLDNDLVPLAFRAPPGSLLNKQLAYRYTTEMRPTLAGVPTDRGMLTPPPLVPRRIAEFALELLPHAEYKFDYGMPHWLAKLDRMISPIKLERVLLGRQKYYHFRTWYRHALASQVKEVLLDPRTLQRGLFNRKRVEEIVQAHTRGDGNHTTAIHKLMACEFVHRELLERAPPAP